MVQRLRDTVERSLGALIVARRAQKTADACADLPAVLDGWDGHFTVLMRKRVARHIESCAMCDDDRRRQVNPAALLGATPVFIPAPAWLRERTLDEIQLTSAASRLTRSQKDRRRLLIAAGIAARVLGVIAFIAVGRVPEQASFEPADVEATPSDVSTARPPAEFLAPPTTGAATATASSEPSTSQVLASTASTGAPATVTAPAPEPSAPAETTESVTVRERTSPRPTAPEAASGVVDQPVEEPQEPSPPEPEQSTPRPTAPARTVPRNPMTFTPDAPVVTTIAPIG